MRGGKDKELSLALEQELMRLTTAAAAAGAARWAALPSRLGSLGCAASCLGAEASSKRRRAGYLLPRGRFFGNEALTSFAVWVVV